MVEPINRKKWLNFYGDSVPETDSGSLFHFLHHVGIEDFRRFISISHTVTDRCTWHSAKGEMTDADKVMNPQHFGSDPADIRIRIRKSGWIQKSGSESWLRIRILDHFGWVKFLPPDAMQVRPLPSRGVRPSVRPSVRLSVTFVYSVVTSKRIFRIFSPFGSHTIFPYQTLWQYSDGDPLTGRRMQVHGV